MKSFVLHYWVQNSRSQYHESKFFYSESDALHESLKLAICSNVKIIKLDVC